jgi:hypothetical protein
MIKKSSKVQDVQKKLEESPQKLTDLVWPSREVLAMAVVIDQVHGFTSTGSYALDPNGDAKKTNKELLTFNLIPYLAPNDFNSICKITDADREIADEIIKYYRRLTFGVIADNINDYIKKVFTITQNEHVRVADFGFIASIPSAFYKEIEKKKIEKEIKDTVQEYLGEVGKSIELSVRYIDIKYVEKLECYRYLAVSDTNHLVSFLNGKKISIVNSNQIIRAKIKNHSVNFQTKTLETQLNYVKPLDNILEWQ